MGNDAGRERLTAAVAAWLGVPEENLRGLPADVTEALELRMRDHQSLVLQSQLAGHLRDSVERYRNEAQTDPLTGLLNRRGLMVRLEQGPAAWSDSWRVGLVLLDVDGLKTINDTHGHIVGDHVLQHVGTRLRQTVRSGDLVARIGGDEFVVACPAATPPGMERLAEKLREQVCAGRLDELAPGLAVTVSLGWAISGDGLEPQDLLHAADEAMYGTRRSVRGRRE